MTELIIKYAMGYPGWGLGVGELSISKIKKTPKSFQATKKKILYAILQKDPLTHMNKTLSVSDSKKRTMEQLVFKTVFVLP